MKLNRYFRFSAFLGTMILTVAIASPGFAQNRNAPSPLERRLEEYERQDRSPTRNSDSQNYKLPTEIADIAKSTVVRIEPTIASYGSGVIIGRYSEGGQQVYVILTAAHVVQHDDDVYNIITPQPQGGQSQQREKIKISSNDIERLPNVDLAVVRFRSDRNYATATLGDSDYTTEGAGVYVAGFPNPGAAIRRHIFQFTSSLVAHRLDLNEYAVEGEGDLGALEGGYAMVYTNVTRAGMNGGPIFDVAGHVVGIHGMGDADGISLSTPGSSPTEASSSASEYIQTGFNLGIPIRTFLNLRPNAIHQFNIDFERSQPGVGDSRLIPVPRRPLLR